MTELCEHKDTNFRRNLWRCVKCLKVYRSEPVAKLSYKEVNWLNYHKATTK